MAGRPVTRARRQAEAEALAAAAEQPEEPDADEPIDAGDNRPRRGRMTIAVEEAIEQMTWLTVSDRGMVALAKAYAGWIDGMPTANVTQTLGLRLEQVLLKLGGAPAERAAIKDLGGSGAGKQGKLAGLRSIHGEGGQQKADRSA